MTMQQVLLYFVCKYSNYLDQLKAIANKEPVDKNLLKVFLELFKDVDYVTCIDEDYPDYLKHDTNPPLVIFYVDKSRRVILTNAEKALAYIRDFN